MGRHRIKGYCTCGHHFRPVPHDPIYPDTPKAERSAIALSNAVRRVGPDTRWLVGADIYRALTENA